MLKPIPKLRQISIISKKLGFLSEKFENLPAAIDFNNFAWNFAHVFFLVIVKSVKNECVETSYFLHFCK